MVEGVVVKSCCCNQEHNIMKVKYYRLLQFMQRIEVWGLLRFLREQGSWYLS